jgi:DNA repair protein RadC
MAMSVEATVENVSLALNGSDGISASRKEANAPGRQCSQVWASPELIAPSTGEGLKCAADSRTVQRGEPELASQGLSGDEILRRLLSPVSTEPDIGRAADKLLARFGTLGAILSADAVQLGDVVDHAVVDHLQVIYLALQRSLHEKIQDRPIIGSWSALEEYAAIKLRHRSDEKLLALFLDRKNGLIREECMELGAFDQTPRYCGVIARRALELHAHAVALAHNHPAGDAMPSRADVEITKRLILVLSNVEMVLHDHAVVGRNTIVSMRSMHLI